jgi:hypothetical protein
MNSNIPKEILLGTNAECTRNFSHGIIPIFYWLFPKEFFQWKKFQLTKEGFCSELLRIKTDERK